MPRAYPSAILLVVVLLFAGAVNACASAPKVSLNEIPVMPGATELAPDEHVMAPDMLKYVIETDALNRRNFNLGSEHADKSLRVPSDGRSFDAQRTDIKGWYFQQLDAAGWRSRFAAAAYTVYVNGPGQNLTVYVMPGKTDADDIEIMLTLNR